VAVALDEPAGSTSWHAPLRRPDGVDRTTAVRRPALNLVIEAVQAVELGLGTEFALP
jgi:hypothetical protein